MKTIKIPRCFVGSMQRLAIAFGALSVCFSGSLCAQTPCPDVGIIATGLLGPSKIIQTPLGNLLVAEVGPPDGLNSARVSIVDRNGNRWTLLDGLPSARAFVGDPSGTSGLYLHGRTLYVVNGQGDVTLAGPVQGTEKANPTPASPIFSSVLAVDFPESLETNTTGFQVTLTDHHTLKSNSPLAVTNISGESTTIRLVVDFVDYLPDPRPNFADNVRHSHPYGIVADNTHLYVVDGGFNNVRKVEIATGQEQTLASFPPTPSPLTNGPPVIENVPTSIHWVGGQLLVTTFGGAPFLPGLSKVVQVHPQTGVVVSLVEGLTAAIDSTPLSADTLNGGLLTLEYDLSFPQPGMGRLQSFIVQTGNAVTHSTCLVTPSSMLIDRTSGRLILAELSTGRLVWLPVPTTLIKGGYIYWSNFAGGDIRRANLDGTGQKVLVSGLPNPIGPNLDLARGHMYWGNVGGARELRRANLDGTAQQTLMTGQGGAGAALDLAGSLIYGTDAVAGQIWRANLDGTGKQVLVTGLNDPHSAVLDLVGGKIYWPEFGGGNIWRANLDGTDATILIPGLAGPSLMTLDIAGGKMYWASQGSGDIRRANLDGSGQEILVQNQNSPAGVAVDLSGGHIYWSNVGGGDIRQANLDGTGQKILISGLSGPAFLMLDFSPLRTPNIQTATKTDSTFTLNWNALMGRGYQVQFKAGLTQTNWTNPGGPRTATNTTMTATFNIGSDPQQVYRVGLLP